MELNSTNALSNRSVSAVLVRGESVELGGDDWVLPVRIGRIAHVGNKRPAWVGSWDHIVENTETISTARVEDVVAKLSKFGILWANVGVEGWSNGRSLQIEPHAVSLGASAVISAENVVWMGDPEAGWSLVSVEKTVRFTSVNDEIVLNQVLRLDGILDEHGVAHGLVVDVAGDFKVVNTVECGASVVSLMDRVLLDVRLLHGANHMEMDRVATKHESLTNISELAVLDPANDRFITW